MAKRLGAELLPFIIIKLLNLCAHLAEAFIPSDFQEYNESTELNWIDEVKMNGDSFWKGASEGRYWISVSPGVWIYYLLFNSND